MASAANVQGIFGFSWAAMQFIFSPLLGAISDRAGRRPVILLSNLGLGLDYLAMAVAPSLGWLFAGRLISGITSSSFSAASAYIADVTPEEGAVASLAGVTGMVGPLVFTQMFAFGISSRSLHVPGAPYLLSATLLGLSFVLASIVARQ